MNVIDKHNIDVMSDKLNNRILLLDVARRHMDKDTIISLIDAINTETFNKVQLHLSDNEGFAPIIPGFTESIGWLSFDDINDVILHATGRGLKTVIDIELFSHSEALNGVLSNEGLPTDTEDTTAYYDSAVANALMLLLTQLKQGITFNVDWCLGCDEVPGNVDNQYVLSSLISQMYNIIKVDDTTQVFVWNDSLNPTLLSLIPADINVVYWQDSDVNTLKDDLLSSHIVINANASSYYFNCVDISDSDYIATRLHTYMEHANTLTALWGEHSLQAISTDQLIEFIKKL